MDSEDERIIQDSSRIKDVKRRRTLKIIGVCALLFAMLLAVGAVSSYVTLKSAAQDGTELAQQIQKQCELPGTTDPDLAQFCPRADEIVEAAPEQVKVDPVPGPEGPTGPEGPAGPAPTQTQVDLAVSRLCIDTPICRGPAGKDVTPDMVALAVRAYCSSDGQCKGATGSTGAQGEPGTDGIDGASATQEQIDAAVTAYCNSRANCQGPAGPAGADGQNGSNGAPGTPGVVSFVDNCDPAPDGMFISDVNTTYDSDNQTATISCTYKDDQSGILTN